MRLRAVMFGCALLGVSGCATMAPQHVGQVAGTVVGSAIAPGIGTTLGNVLGFFVGMLFQKQVDQATAKRERVELGEQLASVPHDATLPASDMPGGIPTRVWVDEAWQDGRWVAAHYEQQNLQ